MGTGGGGVVGGVDIDVQGIGAALFEGSWGGEVVDPGIDSAWVFGWGLGRRRCISWGDGRGDAVRGGVWCMFYSGIQWGDVGGDRDVVIGDRATCPRRFWHVFAKEGVWPKVLVVPLIGGQETDDLCAIADDQAATRLRVALCLGVGGVGDALVKCADGIWEGVERSEWQSDDVVFGTACAMFDLIPTHNDVVRVPSWQDDVSSGAFSAIGGEPRIEGTDGFIGGGEEKCLVEQGAWNGHEYLQHYRLVVASR